MRDKVLRFPTRNKSPREGAVADVDFPHPTMVRYALVRRELEQIRSRDRIATVIERNTRELRRLRRAVEGGTT